MNATQELFNAVRTSNIDWLVEILGNRADPDGRDPKGRSALHAAAHVGETFAGELLVLAGANPNAVDSGGLAPIHLAAIAGRADFCAMLIDNGADPDRAAGAGKRTALHMAAEAAAVPGGAAAGIPTCRALLAGGANPNARDARGATPLIMALTGEPGGLEAARLLMDAGADPMAEADGMTALEIAAASGNGLLTLALGGTGMKKG